MSHAMARKPGEISGGTAGAQGISLATHLTRHVQLAADRVKACMLLPLPKIVEPPVPSLLGPCLRSGWCVCNSGSGPSGVSHFSAIADLREASFFSLRLLLPGLALLPPLGMGHPLPAARPPLLWPTQERAAAAAAVVATAAASGCLRGRCCPRPRARLRWP